MKSAAIAFSVGILTIFLSAVGASADEVDDPPKVTMDCSLGFVKLMDKITSERDVKFSQNADWYIFEVPVEKTLYTVTKPSQYAYPTIVLRQFRQSAVERSACGYGNQASFDRLMKDFEAHDKKIIDSLSEKKETQQ